MNIREAKREDADAIGILEREFGEYLRELGSTTEIISNMDWYLRDGFGDNPAFYGLVAEVNNKVVGYTLYHSGYDVDSLSRVLYVIDLFVHSDYRRQGIGRSLMERLSEICIQQGGKYLVWEVWARNKIAIEFYKRIGAHRDKEMMIMVLPMTKKSTE
ncbi:MAG TPA: GNAT family N-acetyltransferase [Dehalococcoidia bacterium]|nr:GNAT family N-acetyltransferase [Dehalococcoidia bacterium]